MGFTVCTCHDRIEEEENKKRRCTETRSIIQFSIYEHVFRFFFRFDVASQMHDSGYNTVNVSFIDAEASYCVREIC